MKTPHRKPSIIPSGVEIKSPFIRLRYHGCTKAIGLKNIPMRSIKADMRKISKPDQSAVQPPKCQMQDFRRWSESERNDHERLPMKWNIVMDHHADQNDEHYPRSIKALIDFDRGIINLGK